MYNDQLADNVWKQLLVLHFFFIILILPFTFRPSKRRFASLSFAMGPGSTQIVWRNSLAALSSLASTVLRVHVLPLLLYLFFLFQFIYYFQTNFSIHMSPLYLYVFSSVLSPTIYFSFFSLHYHASTNGSSSLILYCVAKEAPAADAPSKSPRSPRGMKQPSTPPAKAASPSFLAGSSPRRDSRASASASPYKLNKGNMLFHLSKCSLVSSIPVILTHAVLASFHCLKCRFRFS